MMKDDARWTVVTGSTGGIASEIVRILARRGDDLILVNRTKATGDAQRAELLAGNSRLMVEVVTADFMDTNDIVAAIDTITAIPGRLDTLYNNAGVLNSSKILSEQGFESNYAVNTLAPYQLIRGLRPKMARSANERPAMVVNFASSAVNQQKALNLSNLVNPKEVTGLMGTYAQTKLAITALTASLAEELTSDNILIRAVDPGATKTAMTTNNSSMPRLLQWLAPLFFSPADKQAAKVVESADPLALGRRSGILVSNLRERRLPKPASNPEVWRDLVALLDRSLRA
ncbi:MAG: SDR family NAD(P)-dependent oxidoreductase [Pseudomonadota bacterium]